MLPPPRPVLLPDPLLHIPLSFICPKLSHASCPQVADAITSYLKAGDSSNYQAVVEKAKGAQVFDDLVKFLLMVGFT